MKVSDALKALAITQRLFALRDKYENQGIAKAYVNALPKSCDTGKPEEINEFWLQGFNAAIQATTVNVGDLDLNELVAAINIEPAVIEALTVLQNSHVIEKKEVP